MNHKHLISTLLISTALFTLKGQTLDDARSWYLEGRYEEALPLFQRAFTDDSTHVALHQWLGVSLLRTGRIVEAERYLTYADNNKIPEASLYLGELYSKLYRFEDAEKAFEKYQKANRRNEEALSKLDRFREEAGQLRRRALRTEDVQIIDSLVLPKTEFLKAYQLSRSSGTLLPLHAFFKEVMTGNETLYLNEKGDKVYYSKESKETGHDLYAMDKLLDHFGNEQRLPETINGEGHQAFPFVMSDGLTIYFASTGHQSLGGYDLFVTRLNLSTDNYLTPNQLNMPFNSPFNDYMMVLDEEKGIGWFASDRLQASDSLCIYTFVPNPQVTLVESDNPEYLFRRASISSIADSWREGVDYLSLRRTAQQFRSNEEATTTDFEFIINDERVYHQLDDFTNSHARALFSQALGLEKQLMELNSELADKRERIATGENTEGTLSASVLELEKESGILHRQIKKLKTEARNEEIRQTPL